jgi:transcriptional/translational regulatory protein YebC/TACO1
MGASGCVAWNFTRKGVLVIDNEDEELEEDNVMMDALDAGAADFEAEDEVFTVYTDPDDFNTVADALTAKGYQFVSAQIEQVPSEYKKLENEEDVKNMEKLLDAMEDDDDVQNVWHNWDRD